MAEAVEFPLATSPDELREIAIEYIQSNVPGWEPSDGQFDVILIEAIARVASEVALVAVDVPLGIIFRYFGRSLLGLPAIEASAAQGDTTWVARDNSGYTIAAGTAVGIRSAGDELQPFEVVNTVIIPPGETTTEVGAVGIRALEEGSTSSGLDGAVELIDSLAWVDSITLVGQTSGGVDAEAEDAYLDRLREELQLLSPRPILPHDFEVLARRVAGVARATAVDGYNPATQTYENERMIAVAVVDEEGEAVSTGVKNTVDATLQSLREVNFVVNVVDPDYATVDVAFTAVAYPGYDPDEVASSVVAALTEYLSPANWGVGPLDDMPWVNEDTLRYLEVAEVINRVVGVRYITTLTINLDGEVPGTVNVNLPGPVPLTRPGNLSGTVTES